MAPEVVSMDVPIKPIILLADSQLLFWSDGDELFLDRARRLLESAGPRTAGPKAAYVGASNGDRPEFFQLFQAAMDGIGVTDCRLIPAQPSPEDLAFFDSADLILLAGGDVERGWRAFEDNGLNTRVAERYTAGALLIGLSAGAIQLGLHGCRSGDEIELFETFKLIPLLIDVHQEPGWQRLNRAMPQVGDYVQGLGIPSGGGAVVHPDMTVEPVRRPLTELSVRGGEVRQNLILPPAKQDDDSTTAQPPVRDNQG